MKKRVCNLPIFYGIEESPFMHDWKARVYEREIKLEELFLHSNFR
jgi:hypothetical protein